MSIFVPNLGIADITVAAGTTPTSQNATVLERGDPRITGPQTCGDYAVNFVQPAESVSEGTWTLVESKSKKALFHGDWSRSCTLIWSPDCQKLAFSIAWGSNAEDFDLYDTKAITRTHPTKLVKLGLPKDAEINHFYWKPVKWTSKGDLIFEVHGDYTRKSEESSEGAKGYGVDGVWSLKPDGTVQQIDLKTK